MISTDLNFLAFLKTLEGMDRAEIIVRASRERQAALSVTTGRDKAKLQKVQEYQSDLGMFLHFVRNGGNGGKSWSDAFLASPEWKNTERFRYGNLLDDE